MKQERERERERELTGWLAGWLAGWLSGLGLCFSLSFSLHLFSLSPSRTPLPPSPLHLRLSDDSGESREETVGGADRQTNKPSKKPKGEREREGERGGEQERERERADWITGSLHSGFGLG
jgi:hypothetical protein